MKSIITQTKEHREGNIKAAQRHQTVLCKLCGEKITWWYGRKDRKPTDLSGNVHICEEYKKLYARNKKTL